jgi:hypothetical protein
VSETAAAANARGSVGSSRNRNAFVAALTYQAASAPQISPVATNPEAFPRTRPTTADRVAPSAIRTPISRVRWATKYAITP